MPPKENHTPFIAVALGLTLATLVLFQIYILREPTRILADEATDEAIAVAAGQEVYADNCTDCHGENGQGTRRGPALNTADYLVEASDLSIFDTITNGRPNTGMPAWGQINGGPFTAEDINNLTTFIRAWELTAPPANTLKMEGDAALGAAIYSVTCFGCHGSNGEGTEVAPALNDLEKLAAFDDSWYQQTIAEGRPAQRMPTWGKVLSPAQINDLVAYIRRWEVIATAASSLSGGDGETGDLLAQGKLLFEYTAGDVGCAYCHGLDGKGNGVSGENAPNIQGMTATDTKQAIGDISLMDFIVLSNQEIEAVGAYLQYLAESP